jgi:hypothetical protein
MLTKLQEQQTNRQGCRKIELGCQMSSLNLYAATVREWKAVWGLLGAEAEGLLLPWGSGQNLVHPAETSDLAY